MNTKSFRKFLLAGFISASLAACGGGGGGDSDDNDNGDTNTGGDLSGLEISGIAEAPSGAVAQLHHPGFAIRLANAIFTPAYGAIIGLQPVAGATVELIRIDNDGNQVGNVLATTSTSITGDYALTLPTGVDLSGDLVVRISGSGDTQMRAQVVNQEVDIDPLTEFVLQKFVASDTDLSTLPVGAVAKLQGHVEEFDLTAGADLSAMLAQLESEVGGFVAQEISSINTDLADASSLGTDYRLIAYDFGLHDDDQQYGVGTFSIDVEMVGITISGNANGTIDTEIGDSISEWSNLTGFQNSDFQLSYVVESEAENESGPTLTYDENSVLTGEDEFEEDIDGEFGWRSPASTFQFQKANGSNIFVGNAEGVEVRYRTTEVDGVLALDPAQREGDEVFRGLNLLMDSPTNFTGSDLAGDFGLLTFFVTLRDNGAIEIQTETAEAEVTDSVFNIAQGSNHTFEIFNGSTSYGSDTSDAESGISYSVNSNGDITSLGGDSSAYGMVDSNAEMFVISHSSPIFNSSDNEYDNATDVEYAVSFAVRLPTAQVSIANRSYRVFYSAIGSDSGSDLGIMGFGFGSAIDINANGDGASGSIHNRSIFKGSFSAEVEAESSFDSIDDLAISVDAAGNLSLSVDGDDGVFSADGYLSEDGKIGVLQTRFLDNGDSVPEELGLMILVDITSGN